MKVIPKDVVQSGYGVRCWVTAAFFGSTKEQVKNKIDNYFESWPPQGYDTHILVNPSKSIDGFWWARVRRFSTCD